MTSSARTSPPGGETKRKIGILAEAMVMAEVTDIQALAALHLHFKEIAESWAGASRERVQEICGGAQSTLESIIVAEVKDPAAAMGEVSAAVSLLQALAGDHPAGGLDPASGGESHPGSSTGAARGDNDVLTDGSILRDFLQRQPGVLEDLEEKVLALENGGAAGAGPEILRMLHTLKGEAALLGLSEVESLCHAVEDFLGKGFHPRQAETLFKVTDWMGIHFAYRMGKGVAADPVETVLAHLAAERGGGETGAVSGESATPEEGPYLEEGEPVNPDPSLVADFVHESLEHLEAADLQLMTLETDSGNSEAVNAVFRAFHTIKGVAGFLDLRSIQAFAHETENLLDRVRQGKLTLSGTLIDLVFDAVDFLKKRIQWLAKAGGEPYPSDRVLAMRQSLAKIKAASMGMAPSVSAPPLPAAAPGMRLGDILVGTGALPPESLGHALIVQKAATPPPPPLGEILVRDSGIPAKEVAQALRSQKAANEQSANEKSAGLVKETVKVEAERLDKLLDAIGELVIAESMLLQSPELTGRKSPVLLQQMASLDKITRELQQMGTSLRMVPVKPVFQKMARLVRDLSRKTGKNVEFLCTGDETELDKTVVDKIGDPLVHMVRNSVDHGIEATPEDRVRAGKPPQAKVALRAFQKGANVCIEISDDGRGLNRESILRKARERGLLKDDGAALSDREVWSFIFEAGFSTAAEVTEVSGRGVGMDVVRRNIEELRGRIEIESRPGEGTTFSIWLPLTLAIIDGMIMRLGRERFVFPTLSILRIVPIRQEDIRTLRESGRMLLLHGEMVPFFDLEGLFPGRESQAGESPRLAVIVESDGRKAGLPVDELLGQQQVVIKGLGETMKQIPGLSGGAILSDGTVGVILDVDGLLKGLQTDPVLA